MPVADCGARRYSTLSAPDAAGKVAVTIDGKKHSLSIPGYEAGMYGLFFWENGFVALDGLRVE